jgi:two-component system chemotaxis response regulator CheY
MKPSSGEINVGMNILIVDDSMLIRQVVKKVLKQVGLQPDKILEANDGKEALAILEREEAGLVLSDINMPNMDGLQLLMHLRQTPKYETLPVIVVSTEGSEETMREAMELGANGYVLKPFTAEAMARQLRPLGLIPEQPADGGPKVDLDDPTAF